MRLAHPRRVLLSAALLAGVAIGGSGCQQADQQRKADAERFSRLELRLQQLEQRLNQIGSGNGRDPAGKAPAGAVKSLTFRTGTEDDRLRIYWADGSNTDLPCTQEQNTWVCG
ncbi:MAG: hypothetical protein R6W06_04270 [Prochlorococcaceae cyanobacterium]